MLPAFVCGVLVLGPMSCKARWKKTWKFLKYYWLGEGHSLLWKEICWWDNTSLCRQCVHWKTQEISIPFAANHSFNNYSSVKNIWYSDCKQQILTLNQDLFCTMTSCWRSLQEWINSLKTTLWPQFISRMSRSLL